MLAIEENLKLLNLHAMSKFKDLMPSPLATHLQANCNLRTNHKNLKQLNTLETRTYIIRNLSILLEKLSFLYILLT